MVDKFTENDEKEAMESMLRQQVSLLEIVNEEVASIKTVSEKERKREEVIDWTITYVTTSISRLYEKQKMMISMLGDNTKLTPDWLRPGQLAAQIQMISDNLPENAKLIGSSMNEKIWNVYQFASLKTIVTDRALVIVIEIPLVSSTKYDYFEIIPLPFLHNKELMTIANVNKHIWIGKEEIYILAEGEFENCIKNGREYFCKQKSEIIKTNEQERCEWQLFKNKTAHSCSAASSDSHEQWIKLKDDIWLFIISEETEVEIECDGKIKEEILKVSGTIEIKNNCKIETKKSKIWTQQIVTSATEIKEIQVHTVKWPAAIKPNFETNTKKNIWKLKDADERLWWHSFHHYFAIYTIAMIIIILTLMFKKKFELEPIP